MKGPAIALLLALAATVLPACPAATLSAVGCPVPAVIGEKDVHVPPKGNLEALRRALDSAGNRDYRVEELPGVNHFLQTAETGSPREYGKIEETISPAALELIGDWILERTMRDRDRTRQ